MLGLLRIVANVFIIIVLNSSGSIVRSESPPYCGYLSNTTTSTCPGDVVEIRYPFWIENRTSDEAGDCTSYYPGFQVKCAANGRPVINISNNLYYVLEIDSYGGGGGGSLRVVDVEIDAQECPQPRRNISLDLPRFLRNYYGGRMVNMTFFYNCSGYPEKVVQHVPCLYNSTRGPSFALFEDEVSTHQFDWYGSCDDAVTLSNLVFDYDYTGALNYTEALKSGFDLGWVYPVNCGNCELSGGKCWANQTNQPLTTTTSIHCNCPDYTTRLDGICFGPYHDSYYGQGPAPAPTALSPLAADSPVYYRSFDNGTSIGLKTVIGVPIGVGGLLLSLLVI